MSKYAALVVAAVIGLIGVFYFTNRGSAPTIEPTATTTPQVSATIPSTVSTSSLQATSTKPVVASNEKNYKAYLTAYGWPDNTPPGSAAVSNPRIHQLAGGAGTFADPITLAVGHSYATGVDVLDYKAGTKFYIPNLRKYFIVEDTCGDGETPQNGPCHTGYEGHPWLDLWVGGEGADTEVVYDCQEAITGLYKVIENPKANYIVTPGDIAAKTGCAAQFGDTIVTK